MTDRRISELPAASGLDGTELVPVVQGGATVQTTAAKLRFSYVHTQASPSATWTIPHNLAGYPAVTVETSAGDVVLGDVAYPDPNNAVVTFGAAFSGRAFLS